MVRRFALAALLAGAALAAAAPRALSQEKKPAKDTIFLWKATGAEGAEVWLFGSIHYGTKDMYPLPAEVEKAFEASKKLAVEADIEKTDAAKLQELVMSRGLYPEGDSLSKNLKKKTLEAVKAYCAENGIPFEGLERNKPWLVAFSFAALAVQKLGMDPELGLDKHFLKAAKEKKKEVLELESVEYQLDLVSSFTPAEQDANLLAAVSEADKVGEMMPKLVQAWKDGDAAKLEELTQQGVKEHPETKPILEKMLDKRNEKMADKIEGYLKAKEKVFVVVGAAHLVGEKGIPKLLEGKKVKVSQVTRGK